MKTLAIIVVVLLALVTVALGAYIVKDGKLTDAEIEMFKKWLKTAVALAQETYGVGTGKLKFTYVYGQIVEKFPKVAHFVSEEQIDIWIQEAKAALSEIANNNDKIRDIINLDE